MAEIKGVTLKNAITLIGRKGNGFSADVYISGKKAAVYVDHAGSVVADIRYVSPEMKEELIHAAYAYGDKYPDQDILDIFQKDPDLLEGVKREQKDRYPFLSDGEMTDNAMSITVPGAFVEKLYNLTVMEKLFQRGLETGHRYLVECREKAFTCREDDLPMLEAREDYVRTCTSPGDFIIR